MEKKINENEIDGCFTYHDEQVPGEEIMGVGEGKREEGRLKEGKW